MHRGLSAALCALAAAVVLAACGDSQDAGTAAGASTSTSATTTAPSEPLRVGFFAPAGFNSYFGAQAEAGRAWAKENGAEFTVVDPGVEPQKQLTQIQDATAARQFNAFLVFALVGPSLAPSLEKAADAGISVALVGSTITADTTTSDPGVPWLAGRVAQPLSARGAALAEQTIAACEGVDPCEVVYLFNTAGDPQEKAIIDAFTEGLEGESNIKRIADRGPTMAQRGPSVKVTQDLLQAEPGVDVIAALDQTLAGSEVALAKAGRTFGTGDGDVRLVGIGATRHGVESVRSGKWFSTQTFLPADEVTMALDILRQAHEGTLAEPQGIDATVSGRYPVILDRRALEESGFRAQYDG